MSFRDLRASPKAHLFATTAGLCFADPEEAPENLAGAGEDTSLRDELTAAFAEASDGAGDTPAPPPAATAESRARDEQGRFAPKADGQPQSTEPKTPASAAPAAQGEQPAAQQASGPPPSWSAPAKAEWDRLPDAIRQEVVRHEATVQTAKAQWQQKGEQLNRLTSAIGDRADRWRMAGFDPAQGIQRLVAAEEFLERDPVNGIAHLARQYGVSLQHLLGALGPQAQAPQIPPALQGMFQEVQTLKQALTQQQQAAEQAKVQGAFDHIAEFRADPANRYFENVRERMGVLLQTGQAASMKDAYDQACWSDPQVRATLQQGQVASQAQLNGQRAKAAQARHASGSITGSPAPGASPARGGQNPNASVRDDLMAAYAEHAA